MSRPFYITTTLPYVNADPHIGFALEIIQADALARYHRLIGDRVIFNTGTDEHGLKIYRKALEQEQDPQTYCDEYAAKFHALKTSLNLTYTHFIRTTDEHHMVAAQAFWLRCLAAGDIYKRVYQVKYCVGCELEKTDSELVDDHCPVHPNLAIELIDEENYFFKFSRFQKPLLDMYREHPDFVMPPHRLDEIHNFVEKGLEDFSISRLKSKMPWGVPVPNDPDHVMYVWFDALINYISTLGWSGAEDVKDAKDVMGANGDFDDFWPGVQVAGKDNLRQQSAMWQAMLASAGLPFSRQVFIHGFITAEGQKISKSLGNVVDPIAYVNEFGVDALRYYLLKEIPSADDGDFSRERFIMRYRVDLCNDLGNLVYRVLSMFEKYFSGVVPARAPQPFGASGASDSAYSSLEDVVRVYEESFDAFDFKRALEALWTLVAFGNAYVDRTKPWALAKNNPTELARVMYQLVELVRVIGVLLQPFLPASSEKILAQFHGNGAGASGAASKTTPSTFADLVRWGVLEEGAHVSKGEPLFAKLEE